MWRVYSTKINSIASVLDNNIKRYYVDEHKKSVEGKRGKAELSLCFSSVPHVIVF